VPGTGDGGTIVGFVYVNDNAAGANSVAGFARNADGSLIALPGSPFAVGGSGTGTSIGSQGALARSADERFLLAPTPATTRSRSLGSIRTGASPPSRPVQCPRMAFSRSAWPSTGRSCTW
jgi:hypothetical protein